MPKMRYSPLASVVAQSVAPPPTGDVVAIVRWRGLFRELGEGSECDAMVAWIAAQAG